MSARERHRDEQITKGMIVVIAVFAFIQGLWQTLRLDWALICDPRVVIRHKLMFLGIIGYVASPLDFIPDLVPLGGQVDDLIVLMVRSKFVWDLIPEAVMAEHRDRIFGPPTPASPGQFGAVEGDSLSVQKKCYYTYQVSNCKRPKVRLPTRGFNQQTSKGASSNLPKGRRP